jgi:hypothetical protein
MELSDLRLWLFGLIIDCPMGKSLDNCPANELRKLSVTEIIEVVDTISEEKLQVYIAHHKKCIGVRENNEIFQ